VRPAGANELAKRRMTSRLWSRRAAAHDASQRCLSAFGGKECTAMSPQWQTTASSMKRRAPGGTDTHEYCNVCDARTPFLRQCPSASVALIDKCYDGATNHSAGFATLGLYVVQDFLPQHAGACPPCDGLPPCRALAGRQRRLSLSLSLQD
jgi:hypothetical protein